MTAASMLPAKPPDHVDHNWRCAAKGPIVESTARQPNGLVRVVKRCESCGGTDLHYRMQQDAAERTDRTELEQRRREGLRQRHAAKLGRIDSGGDAA